MNEPGMMAACGLDCGSCSIRRYRSDAAAAAEVIPWFRKMGWLKEDEGVAEAVARNMVCHGCHGCHGNRAVHWSADCWILQCCVDQRRLRHCAECDDFPCARLLEWSQKDDSYAKAVAQLQGLRRRGTS